MDSFWTNLLIFWPVLAAIICVISIPLAKEFQSDNVKIILPCDMFSIELPFTKNRTVARIALLLSAILLLTLSLCRDYSHFFPTNYTLKISYKDKDVDLLLSSMDESFLNEYKIPKNWKIEKNEAWESMLRDLSSTFNEKIIVSDIDNASIIGPGYMSVQKTGFMQYAILDSWGYLDHTIHREYQNNIYIYTRCKLDGPAPQHIKLTDLFNNKGSIFIEGTYLQYVYTPNALVLYFKVLAVTEVQLFPLKIGKTLYLYEDKEGLTRVPIGVAENIPVQ